MDKPVEPVEPPASEKGTDDLISLNAEENVSSNEGVSITSTDQLPHPFAKLLMWIRRQKAFFFIAPSFFIITLFVYIPILFALIVSFFENPKVSELANEAAKYYSTWGNTYWVPLSTFSEGLLDTGIFYLLGVVGIILGSKWGRTVAKRAGIKDEAAQVFTSLYANVLIAPLIILGAAAVLARLPSSVRLPIRNYHDLFTRKVLLDEFMRILFNTFFWTITCTFFHIALGMLLAVMLNREFKGRGLLRTTFILPWAIPSFVTALIWRNFIFQQERGVVGKMTADIEPGSAFHLTLADIFATLCIVIAFVVFLKLAQKQFEGKWPGVVASFVAFIVCSGFIVLLFQANTTNIPLFGNSVFKITDTRAAFWVTSDFYFFNIRMKTVMLAAIIANIWLGVPFMMVSFLAALQSIPTDLYEAAEIDGASAWTQFTAITFPMLKPTLRTVALLGVIWTFNMFNLFYVFGQGYTLRRTDYDIFITYVYFLFQQGPGTGPAYAYAAALSFVIFAILVAFSKAYQTVFPEEPDEEIGETITVAKEADHE